MSGEKILLGVFKYLASCRIKLSCFFTEFMYICLVMDLWVLLYQDDCRANRPPLRTCPAAYIRPRPRSPLGPLVSTPHPNSPFRFIYPRQAKRKGRHHRHHLLALHTWTSISFKDHCVTSLAECFISAKAPEFVLDCFYRLITKPRNYWTLGLTADHGLDFAAA